MFIGTIYRPPSKNWEIKVFEKPFHGATTSARVFTGQFASVNLKFKRIKILYLCISNNDHQSIGKFKLRCQRVLAGWGTGRLTGGRVFIKAAIVIAVPVIFYFTINCHVWIEYFGHEYENTQWTESRVKRLGPLSLSYFWHFIKKQMNSYLWWSTYHWLF